MLRRVRSWIGVSLSPSSSKKRIADADASEQRDSILFRQPDMWETIHEVAIYIHRFHNLDLFQQGWYQIKITMRMEDRVKGLPCVPARVVQYEAPDLTSDDFIGVWRIDDADHSFYTQPFKIKFARQDILLSVMVSFNLALEKYESPSASPAILKFELMYAPTLENRSCGAPSSLDTVPAAVHEFRIPTKALVGLHSYCPVYFDAFHAVVVDLSMHIVFLKAGTPSKKVSSSSQGTENVADEYKRGPNQLLDKGIDSKEIELVKSLLSSREIILEELQKISKAIGQTIEDVTDADLNLGKFEAIGSSLKPDLIASASGVSPTKMGARQLARVLQIILEKSDGITNLGNDVMLYTLSEEQLLEAFLTIGDQLSLIWNAFLKFHRINRTKILEYLYHTWATDRKAEWSIWMIHSKIEIPHRYLKSGFDDPSYRHLLGKASIQHKSSDGPVQSAVSRAELHRKSIAQMKINSRSIQDMQIFGDPSRVPILLVEQHVMNFSPHGSTNECASTAVPNESGEKAVLKLLGHVPKRNNRILKVVVFVHGFQGHHLDLRLVRNQWLLIDPGMECLMSEVNEEKTSGDFREMGSRLAEEVTTFLRRKMDKLSKYGGCRDIRISFVGHSIGNIIIRSALTDIKMGPFLKHLYTYVSVSGPHLGYCYSSNSLFNSGLWLLKKLKGAQCIHQLTLSDDPDLKNTFFYNLCKQKTLENFKNIILLSSPQDGYVPYHSARIELCPASSWDSSKKADVFMEMLNNCLDQLRAPSSERRTFMRCDVNFDTSTQGRNLNTIIGRAAHIEFLETDAFARFIMWSFPDLFLMSNAKEHLFTGLC